MFRGGEKAKRGREAQHDCGNGKKRGPNAGKLRHYSPNLTFSPLSEEGGMNGERNPSFVAKTWRGGKQKIMAA